jgi:hypothetical protein
MWASLGAAIAAVPISCRLLSVNPYYARELLHNMWPNGLMGNMMMMMNMWPRCCHCCAAIAVVPIAAVSQPITRRGAAANHPTSS